ncbi:MAG: alkaline phosphatase PhoX, partial [Chloroflexota bacterium]
MKSKLSLFGTLMVPLLASVFLLSNMVTQAQDDATIPKYDLTNPAAPFIFSHDVAIEKGATAEWRKMEGLAMDATKKMVYFADTAITKGMSDDKGDIQLKENPCGVVWAGQLDSDNNISALKQVIVGGPFDDSNKDYSCNQDAIANPDNLSVDSKGNLWIGEDTDYHHNQILWMWNGKELKRFATMPEGAEVTGVRAEPNGTLFLNIQHPSATNVYPYNRATVGVITGFKAGDDFTPVSIPTGDDMKTLKLASGQYQVLARAGETLPNDTTNAFAGQITRADGGTLNTCNNPDGNMFLPTTSTGTEGYLYSNWECVPGGVSKLYIKQGSDGTWTSIEGQNVDFSSVNGTQNNCNASVTPWNTALTSEEYAPDVQEEWDAWESTKDAFSAHLGKAGNPLDYGYIVELTPAGGEDNGIG